jgi:hypothetical protein
MIWKWTSLHPRIVHLSKKRLAVDDDPNWWRSVRSDNAIEAVEDDSESDYGSFDDEEIHPDHLEMQVAKKRLLTPDSKYGGNISRADAKAILRYGSHWRSPALIAGWDHPKTLYGLRSESPVPGVLLACRESFDVGCRVYSRAFGTLGAVPETWFNFGRDTLYLDDLTHGMPYAICGLSNLGEVLGELFARDELARVERLAVHPGSPDPYEYINDTNLDSLPLFQFSRKLRELVPNVGQLTIVDGHYAHRDRTIFNWGRSGEQYINLKFMKSAFDSAFCCWRLNGFRIDAALLHGGINSYIAPIWNDVDRIQKYWDSIEGGGRWQLPKTNMEVVVSTADEERLLRDAYLFEKEHNKGCWYINPSDPTDCDYFAGDEIDEGIESLL